MADITKEVKEKHRLDIYLRYLDPDNKRKPQLTPAQQESLDLMYKARHWSISFFSPDQVRKLIQDEGGKDKRSYSRACQILIDSDYIFGSIQKLSKPAQRAIYLEYLHKAIQMIIQDKESKGVEKGREIAKIVSEMAELTGAKDFSENVDPTLLMPAQMVNFIPVGIQVNVKR